MQAQSPSPSPMLLDARPGKADVAELSCERIESLDQAEMLEVIRAAELPMLSPEAMAHVEFLPSDELRRVVYLARECCRHQGY